MVTITIAPKRDWEKFNAVIEAHHSEKYMYVKVGSATKTNYLDIHHIENPDCPHCKKCKIRRDYMGSVYGIPYKVAEQLGLTRKK